MHPIQTAPAVSRARRGCRHVPVLLAALLASTALPAFAQAGLPPGAVPAHAQPVATLDIDGWEGAPGQAPDGAPATRIEVIQHAWSTGTTTLREMGEEVVAHGAELSPSAGPAPGPGTLTVTWRPDARAAAFRTALAEKRLFPRLTFTHADAGEPPRVVHLHDVTVSLVRPAARLQLPAEAAAASDGAAARTEQIAFAYRSATVVE
jgi:hypothetical protein